MPSRAGSSAAPPSRTTPPSRSERVQALVRLLTHDDPSQLLFQIAEIAGDRCYERHGVEVRPGATVLDVGANVGVAAAHFAVNCGAGRVDCFEPVAPVVQLLRRNVGALPACAVHPYGLAAEDGEATVTYYPGATAMSGLHADPARDEALVRQALANLGHAGAAAEAQLSGRYRPQELTCRL